MNLHDDRQFAGAEDAGAFDGVTCILFDLDGTLIDSVELILASFRYATETVLGEALPDEVMMRNVGIPLRSQMEEFSPEHAETLLTVYREHNGRVHDELLREYEGTGDVLACLADQGYRMGVVTSKSAPVALRGLKRFDLERYFEVVVAMEDTERHKPEADPLLHAVGVLGVEVGDCIYVGDAPQDIQAAQAAGMRSVGAAWGVHGAERVGDAGPDAVIEHLAQLPGLLGDGCGQS